ncbi:MAG: transcription antitermination factor NusB [Oscillospiraceae bacterium]
MTRAAAREMAIQLCFARAANPGDTAEALVSFFDKDYYKSLKDEAEVFEDYPNSKQRDYICDIVLGVEAHRDEIDAVIQKYARGWKLSRISKTALAVLRVAIYEILYVGDVPNGVAISEAVALAKGYDMPETVSFINGLLGSFAREGFGQTAGAESETEPESAPEPPEALPESANTAEEPEPSDPSE